MPWIYDQSSGDLFHDETFIGTGYSGKGKTKAEGRNNGEMEAKLATGPIPRGEWVIGAPIKSPTMGPVAIALKPAEKKTAHGRSGFFIHGNNAANDASHGCVIMARGIRLEIVGSGDTVFVVRA